MTTKKKILIVLSVGVLSLICGTAIALKIAVDKAEAREEVQTKHLEEVAAVESWQPNDEFPIAAYCSDREPFDLLVKAAVMDVEEGTGDEKYNAVFSKYIEKNQDCVVDFKRDQGDEFYSAVIMPWYYYTSSDCTRPDGKCPVLLKFFVRDWSSQLADKFPWGEGYTEIYTMTPFVAPRKRG
jgi:hypothetical protein